MEKFLKVLIEALTLEVSLEKFLENFTEALTQDSQVKESLEISLNSPEGIPKRSSEKFLLEYLETFLNELQNVFVK